MSELSDMEHDIDVVTQHNIELQLINAEMLEALQACDEAMAYMSEYDIPLTLPEMVKAAIAKATGKVE